MAKSKSDGPEILDAAGNPVESPEGTPAPATPAPAGRPDPPAVSPPADTPRINPGPSPEVLELTRRLAELETRNTDLLAANARLKVQGKAPADLSVAPGAAGPFSPQGDHGEALRRMASLGPYHADFDGRRFWELHYLASGQPIPDHGKGG